MGRLIDLTGKKFNHLTIIERAENIGKCLKRRREIGMAKSSIIEKNAITIKGILGVNEDDNTIVVELENGESVELASTLNRFDGADVTINVSNSIER